MYAAAACLGWRRGTARESAEEWLGQCLVHCPACCTVAAARGAPESAVGRVVVQRAPAWQGLPFRLLLPSFPLPSNPWLGESAACRSRAGQQQDGCTDSISLGFFALFHFLQRANVQFCHKIQFGRHSCLASMQNEFRQQILQSLRAERSQSHLGSSGSPMHWDQHARSSVEALGLSDKADHAPPAQLHSRFAVGLSDFSF